MVAMPMYHIAGCSLSVSAVYAGMPGVIMREPDPVAIAKAIEAHRVTHVFLVPVLLLFMPQHPPGTRGGPVEPADPAVRRVADQRRGAARRHAAAAGHRFMQVYGLTETTGAITYLPPEDHDAGRRRGCAAPASPTPSTELKIVDPATGEELPPGQVGEILCQTPQNMLGYWSMDQATQRDPPARRLAAHRRRRLPRRGRLSLHPRPRQRHDHLGRGEHLPGRGRERPDEPPGRGRLRGDRRARPEVGRDAEGHRGPRR